LLLWIFVVASLTNVFCFTNIEYSVQTNLWILYFE
jgi:hypothetical protein